MRPVSALQSKRAKVGILWDLDGTVADTAELSLRATNAVLVRHGYRSEASLVTAEEYHAGAAYTTPRRMSWHAVEDPDNTAVGSQLAANFDDLYISMIDTVSLFPEIEGVVEEIGSDSSVAQGVLSNACGRYVRRMCGHLKLEPSLRCCLGADDVAAPKPSPDGLLQSSKAIGVPPVYCMYIGDMATDGVAAKAAGMKSICCVWMGSNCDGAEAQPYFDYIVHDRYELLRLINEFSDYCKQNNRRRSLSIVWDEAVVDNEHEHKIRTDNEYWDGRR